MPAFVAGTFLFYDLHLTSFVLLAPLQGGEAKGGQTGTKEARRKS
jgi:hypothetical protein